MGSKTSRRCKRSSERSSDRSCCLLMSSCRSYCFHVWNKMRHQQEKTVRLSHTEATYKNLKLKEETENSTFKQTQVKPEIL